MTKEISKHKEREDEHLQKRSYYWDQLRRIQRVQDPKVEGKYRIFLYLQPDVVIRSYQHFGVNGALSFLVDFLEHAGFICFSGSLTKTSTQLSEKLLSCTLLIIFAESRGIYPAEKNALELLPKETATMVLLPEQLPLRNIPPSVCHYAILQRTSLTIGEGFTVSFDSLEDIVMCSLAIAMEKNEWFYLQ
ncbi:hypothetical protein LSM04_008473 [Trypanosoma melophagium]|uniref:uncharacterized protein n=1 Tax=Trypanosoma melophagium TaxID=715481 RepID=UPI00351A1349|nr:hypothetical protein LSM04_008473 [Trypanosoma melophagium]